MSKYVIKTLVVTSLYIALHCAAVLWVRAPIAAEYWERESLLVKERIAKETPSPKIIFVGGSSTLFDIDAERVSKELDVPSVNLGLHAGLPLSTLLAESKDAAKAGDVMVLTLEHPYYTCDEQTWSDWQLRNAIAWSPNAFDAMPFSQRIRAIFSAGLPTLGVELVTTKLVSLVWPQLFDERLDSLQPAETVWAKFVSRKFSTQGFVYSAYNLDSHGDMTNQSGRTFLGVGVPASIPNHVCPGVLGELTEFVREMRARDVRTFVAHAPYLIDTAPSEGWRAAEADFSADIKETGATLLDRREDLFMARDLFFNTSLHLSERGKAIRTDRVIGALRSYGISRSSTR